jgi:hypothetical protein
MAYGYASVGRNWRDRLSVCPCYGTEMHVSSTIGAPEEPSARNHTAISYGHEQVVSRYLGTVEYSRGSESMSPMSHSESYCGIDVQDKAREWQAGTAIYTSDDPSNLLVSQATVGDQSLLDIPSNSYDRQSPSQLWPGSSVESTPSRLDEREFGHTTILANVFGGPYHNDLYR